MYYVPPNNVKMQHPLYDKYACWLNDAAINNQKIDCEPLLRRNFEVFSRKSSSLVCCIFPAALFPINLLSLLPFNGAQPVRNKNLKSIQESSINTYFISFISFAALSSRPVNRRNWKKWEWGGAQMHCCLLRCITIYWDAPNILFFMHCLHLLLPHILLSVGAANKYSMLLQRTPSSVAKSHKNDLAHFPISLSSVATFVSDHDMTKSHILPAIIFCLRREYFQGQFFMSKLWKTSPVQTIPKANVTFGLSVILG